MHVRFNPTGRGGRQGRGGRGGRATYRGAGGNPHNPAGFANTSSATRPAAASLAASRDRKPRLGKNSFSKNQIYRHFHPSATEKTSTGGDFDLTGTLNGGEDNHNGVAFVLVYVDSQPNWMTENTIHARSRLHLLPEYAEKKAILEQQHKEPSHEELMERITARLTESIKFHHYDGLEDGPDMELHDESGGASSIIVPGEWMSESHELPQLSTVDTPSVKYRPGEHAPVAVFHHFANKAGFDFVAWFLMEEVELFAANSTDLVRNMHDKGWTGGIDHEWAVVKLLRVEKGEAEWLPPPDIKNRKRAAKGSEKEDPEPEQRAHDDDQPTQRVGNEDDKEDEANKDNRLSSIEEVDRVEVLTADNGHVRSEAEISNEEDTDAGGIKDVAGEMVEGGVRVGLNGRRAQDCDVDQKERE